MAEARQEAAQRAALKAWDAWNVPEPFGAPLAPRLNHAVAAALTEWQNLEPRSTHQHQMVSLVGGPFDKGVIYCIPNDRLILVDHFMGNPVKPPLLYVVRESTREAEYLGQVR